MTLCEKEKFLNEVLHCIRLPFDREKIRTELEDHIQDSTDEYNKQGYKQGEAMTMAVHNMGNAKEIGRDLNKQHRPVIGSFHLDR